MAKTVVLPLWLAVISGALAVWALADRILYPLVRGFFSRREEIFLRRIKDRLHLQIPAFKVARREVLIDRLLSDAHVLKAVDEICREQGVSAETALKKVRSYAEEIIPSFHAYAYYSFGSLIGISFARLLYRVRVGYADEEGLAKIDPLSSLVFIMNHRSNMDYILLGYLTLTRAVLSFAVGEWARVWPIQPLVKAMGAYFVRRGSGDVLYRCVLAGYVRMAVEGGLIQAVYPEGKLSRDGHLQEPKIGILDYMLRDFDPDGERDLVFIPVGVNYDRVLEDRTLLLGRTPAAKKTGLAAALTTFRFIVHNLWLMMRRGWHRFGYAAVYFGTPLSMRDYIRTRGVDFRKQPKEERTEHVRRLARTLLRSVGGVIPVLPVSLVSAVFVENPEIAFSDDELKSRARELLDRLEKNGAHIYLPRRSFDYAVRVGLRMLVLRHLVQKEGDRVRAVPAELDLLEYYANAISHLV